MKDKTDIPAFENFLSSAFLTSILSEARSVEGLDGLTGIGQVGGLENRESLLFLVELYESLKKDLKALLHQRMLDRVFVDERTRSLLPFNRILKRDFRDPDYQTVLHLTDAEGRIVFGPLKEDFCESAGGAPVKKIPPYLEGAHVTLFGPPDDAKLSINAMNAYHRKIKGEPAIISQLLQTHEGVPKWGADDEDSKTPLRKDLISAGENLGRCFDRNLIYTDEKTGKTYALAGDHLSLPIKRFPGLALPCSFLFYRGNPLPLHLYDFALHLFRHWHNPQALVFYVPKLENEEEARYIRTMVEKAETLLRKIHPKYVMGTVRLIIVLENPRIILRVHEVMDQLYPYFAGASLGWHDYLASTARLFKEENHYRIPVKTDPHIVIKYIKASHDLLSWVIGPRGGIKIGGMYGILPMAATADLLDPSFQVTLRGFIKDVITQLKRDLTGFWVAHPDFVRVGLSLVEGWKFYRKGDPGKLRELVHSLLDEQHRQGIWDFITGPDIEGLSPHHPLFVRSLIVADMTERSDADTLKNNDPEEIRYNVFQTLQYLTDWLCGNGCVALPATLEGHQVRVMDDLATAERSRWEVWHEIHHQRFPLDEFLKIVHEEMHFIRKDRILPQKMVQVKWDQRTEKWYPVAFRLTLLLMTAKHPVEFSTELLLPFTVDSIRAADSPWDMVKKLDPRKYALDPYIERFHYYFEKCGSLSFASSLASQTVLDLARVRDLILQFKDPEIREAAHFHGDIGESPRTLDAVAAGEQSLVLKGEEKIKSELREWGQKYKDKFHVKFLISAQGKSGGDILDSLKARWKNSSAKEREKNREALWQITRKRMEKDPLDTFQAKGKNLLALHKVVGGTVALWSGASSQQGPQIFSFGNRVEARHPVTSMTWFEWASLSKTVAAAFSLEFFRQRKIPLSTSVNRLLSQTSSSFRIKPVGEAPAEWADQVTLRDLLSHTALNMHYVNGIPAGPSMVPIRDLLEGNPTYGYVPVGVKNPPGKKFEYSGGGFLVLEHLIEVLGGKPLSQLTRSFLQDMGLTESEFSFDPTSRKGVEYAHGYHLSGKEVKGTRLMFPSFAAGAVGTARGLSLFLQRLGQAYSDIKGWGPLSHDTAVEMLHGTDKGSRAFMGCDMGLGVFIAEAESNRLMIHQGANDGFRCLYVHCFQGPDRGKGFVLFCNGEENGVLWIAQMAQELLKLLQIQGVDEKRFQKDFVYSSLRPEEIVNIGYKNLVFRAFLPDLPEKIVKRGKLDPLAVFNVAVEATLLEVSNQKFALARNLLSKRLPVFDPQLFGKQGKIMDSWETVRHNPKGYDKLVFKLKGPSKIRYISLSTQFHRGNQVEEVRILGTSPDLKSWVEILPKTRLQGHSLKRVKVDREKAETVYHLIKVLVYPDGGFSRLGLYSELPPGEDKNFHPPSLAPSLPFSEDIPQSKKHLALPYQPGPEEIRKNLSTLRMGEEFDVGNLAYGGKILRASNQHYGPAVSLISPFGPINMFDGLESSRSRKKNHSEEVVIQLARRAKVHRMEMDFTYFVNNNPLYVSVHGQSGSEETWVELVGKTLVKPFAGLTKEFWIEKEEIFERIKVVTYPDGGMNRLRIFSFF